MPNKFSAGKGSTNKKRPHNSQIPANEIWLCLRFTHFALNSLNAHHKSTQKVAISFQQTIWQCSALAKQSGIRLGISTSHALMLEPELLLLERNVNAETQKLQELSFWAYRYSAIVSLYNDHCLLIEVGKSLKLFNGLEHLLHLISNDLDGFQLAFEMGVAATPKAAYLLSLEPHLIESVDAVNNPLLTPSGTNLALQKVAIEHLEIDTKVKARLLHCGFEHLSDLLDIPTAEIGSRFGEEFLDYWARLFGYKPDPQLGTTPPEDFESSVDFAEPIQNIKWIEQQIERLLKDLISFTQTRHVFCRGFTWRFFHENNRLLKTVMIGVSGKESSLESFYQLSLLKFETLQLDWEFSSIELSSKHFVPKTLFANDLFDPQTDNEEFNQLVDKLFNRLGRDALMQVSQQAEQLPELINGIEYISDLREASHAANGSYLKENPAHYRSRTACANSDEAEQSHFKDEPLWLMQHAKRLAQFDGKPMLNGPLHLVHGPNRISSHWWSKLQSRDYYIARQSNGSLLWLFYDRGCRQWFLHGLFA